MDPLLYSVKPETAIQYISELTRMMAMENYGSKCKSLRIGPERCCIDIELVRSHICLCSLSILGRLDTWTGPGRLCRSLRCIIGRLCGRLRLPALEGWNGLNNHTNPSVLGGGGGRGLGSDSRRTANKLRGRGTGS